jgi:acetolactate synthase I/II/III large subunit
MSYMPPGRPATLLPAVSGSPADSAASLLTPTPTPVSGVMTRPSPPPSIRARSSIPASRDGSLPAPVSARNLLTPGAPPVAEAVSAPKVLDVFFRYLKAEQISHIFGIPGGLLFPFFEAAERDEDFMMVVAKHEEGAAFMADGFARTTGKIAVCAGTSGPGATNMITGVACAFTDGVPMLVLTGQAASHALGRGAAQETAREDIDIVAMFAPITKYSAMVTSAASFGHHLRRALRLAKSGRPGPVHLNVPVELWEKPLVENWFDPKTYRPETYTFDRNAIRQAAEALASAEFPVLFVGAGVAVSQAEPHLLTLAELLGARVATSPRGKGLFPEDHPLCLGVMGVAGHAAARDTLLGNQVDVLLTVGTSLSETSTLNWSPALRRGRYFIQADIDSERIGRNYPVDLGLVGDAQTVLVELIYHVHRLLREGTLVSSKWSHEAPLERGHRRYVSPELRTSNSIPLAPPRWRVELESVLPKNAFVFSDIGGHMLNNIHHLCFTDEQRFFINLGFGSMGHGVVAPIGAALAHPGRPIVAIVGDGCFAMNGLELLTAVEVGARVVWIVEHNNMHGITWHGSQLIGSRRALESARYKTHIQVAAIAQAMGLATWVVDSPAAFAPAFCGALAHNGPSLLEVRIDASIAPPLGDRTKSLAGFIES